MYVIGTVARVWLSFALEFGLHKDLHKPTLLCRRWYM